MPKRATHMPDPLRAAYLALRTPLKHLFEGMDEAYNRIAARAGFVCRGCPENCCRSRFYHHTYLEYYYLREGFDRLQPAARAKALAAAARMPREDCGHSGPRRPLCPLHQEGACSLYPYRPLICRLHGVPHKLEQPGGRRVYGPGCAEFERLCGTAPDLRLNRTPLYRQMAELENRFKQLAGVSLKIKMTIAEMILAFKDEIHSDRHAQ